MKNPHPRKTLNVFEYHRMKKLCVDFEAQSVTIDGVKYTNLPLDKWRKELDRPVDYNYSNKQEE